MEISEIRYEGFYTDENDNVFPHNEKTKKLYEKGLKICSNIPNTSYYSGIEVKDGKLFAVVENIENVEYIELL